MEARALVCAGALSMALFASGDSIFYDSSGKWVNPGATTTLTCTETLLVPPSTFGSFPALTNLTETDNFNVDPCKFTTGVATYSNGAATR